MTGKHDYFTDLFNCPCWRVHSTLSDDLTILSTKAQQLALDFASTVSACATPEWTGSAADLYRQQLSATLSALTHQTDAISRLHTVMEA
jgi:hypothetical protein